MLSTLATGVLDLPRPDLDLGPCTGGFDLLCDVAEYSSTNVFSVIVNLLINPQYPCIHTILMLRASPSMLLRGWSM